MAGAASCRQVTQTAEAETRGAPGRFFFVSRGKTVLLNADGTGLRVLELDVPGQVTWQPGPFFPDGRRVILLSMEERRDGPGKPFDEYYTLTPTHLWTYDIDVGTLEEIAHCDRIAPFYTPALLIGGDRILVQVVRNKVGQIFNMSLDGTDRKELTRAGEGFPYGLSLSPDGKRVAFHTAGPSPHGYRIWTSDTEGSSRVLVAGDPDHLYFGTSWSPGGDWILYQDCRFREDPGHDSSDICVGRPDGSEHRMLTTGQSAWFGATYGNPGARGSGSNMPAWTRDGSILFSRKLPGSKPAWEFQPNRPDVDHFNRDYKPELARGGAEVCSLDPGSGKVTTLTQSNPPVWDFRASESPDGKHVLFCRAATGEMPSVWILERGGPYPHKLTSGIDGAGADHPSWVPSGSLQSR